MPQVPSDFPYSLSEFEELQSSPTFPQCSFVNSMTIITLLKLSFAHHPLEIVSLIWILVKQMVSIDRGGYLRLVGSVPNSNDGGSNSNDEKQGYWQTFEHINPHPSKHETSPCIVG